MQHTSPSSSRGRIAIAAVSVVLAGAAAVIVHLTADSDYRRIFDYWSAKPQIERPVDTVSIALVRLHARTIRQLADEYGIDPVAIAGIIVAERSLHTGPVNYFEEYYVRTTFLTRDSAYLERLADATSLDVAQRQIDGESQQEFEFRLHRGLLWTVGLCQISILEGRRLEPALARYRGRVPRSMKKVIKALLDPRENLDYCGFELSRIAATYRATAHLDIRFKPEILTTLFNTGRANQEAAQYRVIHGKKPQPNVFGAYVLQHRAELITALH